ncbi:MAG: hypothetical protein JW908_08830 [Anaerolineales bacterium]|nr:hypothetical protein [Anaerolineales bacterium]
MQIRCYHCHKPYALSKDAVATALDILSEEKLHHYNARCPHCGKSTQIGFDALKRAAPNWTPKEETPSDEQSA